MLNEIQADSSPLRRALEILDQGGVVGIPTETVYGLAARVDRPRGLEKIFAVKQRPFFDPLIVHVDSVEMARRYVLQWNEICSALADEFWPGPLSLVLERSPLTPGIVTAGLPTVAVRIPRNGTTLDLIRQAGVGLAAPSANRFGKSSPTTGQHVEGEFGGSVFVLGGQASEIGIESTVLRVSGNQLTLLRPGFVTQSQIEEALEKRSRSFAWSDAVVKGESPGQMKHHYMPDIPLILAGEDESLSDIKRFVRTHLQEMPDEVEGVRIAKPSRLDSGCEVVLSADPRLAAREFYGTLRMAARSGADFIFLRTRNEMNGEIWSAIFDRAQKAASLSTPLASCRP